jgi:hypothetical protein
MQENFANVPAHKQIVPGNAYKPNIFLFREKKRSLVAHGPGEGVHEERQGRAA